MKESNTFWLALYGAILSTVIFLWNILVHIKDRRRRIVVQISHLLSRSTEPGLETWACQLYVNITNFSRATNYVGSPGLIYNHSQQSEMIPLWLIDKEQMAGFPDRSEPKQGAAFPFKLEYAQPLYLIYELTDHFIESHIKGKLSEVEVFVEDSFGKEYKSNKTVINGM